MRRHVSVTVLLALVAWLGSLAVSHEDAQAKRRCANVAIRYPDGTVYTRTSRVIAVNVGCRAARRIVKIYLSRIEGNAGPAPRPRGYRCRPAGNGGRCRKGGRIVLWRYPSYDRRIAAARRCRGFRQRGQPRSYVSAENMSCRRARRIAVRFARTRKLPRGWTARNPAGWEWIIFRRRDRSAIVGNGYRPPGDQPVIGTSVFRGCNS